MSELLVPIATNLVLGIILLALLVWKRASDTVRLHCEADAIAEFQRHVPDTTGTATLTSDGLAALIDTPAGVGLLLRHARRWNARMLTAPELAAVKETGNSTLELRFADFGWPRARLRLLDRDTMSAWRARLDTLVRPRAARATGLRHA